MPTQTKKQVEEAFRKDLTALLNKYSAYIEAEDHYPGYPECGEDIRMTVTIPAIYKGENCRDWTEIDLGQEVSHG